MEAGEELIGGCRAADFGALLKREHPQPGPREIEGRHEAVVAATDDDRVVVHLGYPQSLAPGGAAYPANPDGGGRVLHLCGQYN